MFQVFLLAFIVSVWVLCLYDLIHRNPPPPPEDCL